MLAVAETFACVALYWLLLLWLGVTWHHWMILIATPLVLLRSEQSVALGVKWFSEYYDDSNEVPLRSVKGIGIFAASLVVSGLACWFLASTWLAGTTEWLLFAKSAAIGWLGLNLAVATAAALAGRAAARAAGAVTGAGAVTVAGAVAVAAGFALGVWLRAILIRLTATMRFPLSGAVQFPSNWRFSTTVSDVFHPPELIPGNDGMIYGKDISLSIWKSDGSMKGAPHIAMSFLAVLIYFGPAMLWRWAIKSTAWFYLPLLWVRRGWQLREGEDLQVWAKSYSSKFLNWFCLLAGLIAIAAVTVTLFSLERYLTLQQQLDQAGAPTTILGIPYSLELSELLKLPWLWFYLPSYILTLCIFFALDNIAKDIRAGAAPETKVAAMQQWMWAANARAVLTNLGLGIALVYFLDAVDAWGQVMALVQGLI